MGVNFGSLDHYGHVPAKDLKESIRIIAYNTIRSLLDSMVNDNQALVERIDGVITLAEEMCDQIDEEVAHTGAEIQQIMQKYAEEHKDEPAT